MLNPASTATLILALFLAFSTNAEDASTEAKAPEPPDKEKLSYALGMNLGKQLKQTGAEVDVDVIAQAIRDVLEGKPTRISDSEIRPLFMQAQAYELARKTGKNHTEGEAFLAKNSKAPGVTVLPDGLQYKIITDGAGELPKAGDLVTFNFHAATADGVEYRNKDHFEIPLKACSKGLQEALLLMKVGSKWQVAVPADLAFRPHATQAPGFGSTLIYDIELTAAEPESAHPGEHRGMGRLGHSLDEDLMPPAAAAPVR